MPTCSRRSRGTTPPHNPDRGPVVVRVANCQSVSSGKRHSSGVFRAALTERGKYGVPDVVLACECSDFDAVKIAAERGWQAIQYREDTAKAGSVLAWRGGEMVGKPRLVVGSEAGEGIRTRYTVQAILDVNGHSEPFVAGHAPPDRAPHRQAEWLGRVDDWPGIVGGDFNTHRRTLARRYDRQVRAVGVLALLVPRDIPCSRAASLDIGSDHPGLDVRLWK